MAQGKKLVWADLRVGVFVVVALVILGLTILFVTGAGAIGPKYRLFTFLPQVEGVDAGAPVRLAGVNIGFVKEVRVDPNPPDKFHSIQLTMIISSKFASYVRTDSVASLKTEGLLGNCFIDITRGFSGEPLPDNGSVPGAEQPSMEQMMSKASDMMVTLGGLSSDVNTIIERVKNGQGTLGKLVTDDELYDRLNATAGSAQAMVADARNGRGTLGKLVASDELYNRVNTTVGDADAVIGAVRQGNGTIGKLVNDPAMYQNAQQFIQNGNAVLSGIQAGKGTLGKMAKDDAVYNNLRDASANVRDATAKLNNGKGTAGKFFADPDLYDNLNGVALDARRLLNDFHNDPKKYLHVKFSIF
jgi:phospholipid/cholesterol/gamma-HCH transport system substrate-binding protein